LGAARQKAEARLRLPEKVPNKSGAHNPDHFAWIEQVETVTASYAKDDLYLVAVSGGLDSRVLLALLVKIGFGRLVVCHLNHNLRGIESAEDSRFVRRVCQRQNLEFYSEKLRELPDAGSLEASARAARWKFFARAAQMFGTNRIFLGHHADDQIETFLFNLFRGSASLENAAMKTETKVEVDGRELVLLRPLLRVSKEDLKNFAFKNRLKFREDSSNRSREMTRNRIRLDLIPTIEQAMKRPIRAALLRVIDVAAAEAQFIRSQIPDLASSEKLQRRQLGALPIAIQRLVIHRWLKRHKIKQCGFDEVELIRGLLFTTKIAKVNLPGGVFCRRRAGVLFLERNPTTAQGGS
jgi:tRNA(Ile)-lysidine synthase